MYVCEEDVHSFSTVNAQRLKCCTLAGKFETDV